MYKKITKAVFPVAGFGTRFLPVTKASPKEVLPIVDKPLIQYAVEEAVSAGITDMIFITGRNKRSIEDHFDKAYELEAELALKNKYKMLEMVRNVVPNNINCIYIRQAVALGLGHAVNCAKSVIGDDPFAVILADELIDATPGALAQMVDIYNETGGSVLGVAKVADEEVSSYGIIDIANSNHELNNNNNNSGQVLSQNSKTSTNFKNSDYTKIENIVEKPKRQDAPSNLAVIGRYILTPRIFTELDQAETGVGGEIQLTDAISRLLRYESIYAHQIEGKRYDCGSKLGYLQATVEYGLKHTELADGFRSFLATV